MKTKFIINPISGRSDHHNIESMINKHLDKSRFEHDITYSQYAGHAKEIARTSLDQNYGAIIAVGGDGTVNEISSEIIESQSSLGVIPTGSGNGFAFHLGIHKDPIKSIIQLNTSKHELIDSCQLDNYQFVNVSGIGFDAHIAHLFSKLKKRGSINYIKLVLQELNYQAQQYTIRYNGTSRSINALLISFANTSQYGNHFKISPKANAMDGLIDFVIVKDMPKWRIPEFLIKLSSGKIENSKFVEIIKCKEMDVQTNNTLIHIDGEPKEINKRFVVKNNPKSLNILMPNE